MAMRVAPGQPAADMNDFSSVVLPADIGQSSIQAYVKATGHTVRGMMLDYWRANGASAVYGNPISEPFASPRGYYSQAFENAIFEYHPENQGTDYPLVQLAPIGQSIISEQTSSLRRDRRRNSGGGDPRGSIWMALDPESSAARSAIDEGGFFNEVTGHTVTRDFADWYNANEGAYFFGAPLSQAYRAAGLTLQYFECATLTRQEGDIKLAPIGKAGAELLGVDLTPVDRSGLPEFKEELFTNRANPGAVGRSINPGPQVDRSQYQSIPTVGVSGRYCRDDHAREHGSCAEQHRTRHIPDQDEVREADDERFRGSDRRSSRTRRYPGGQTATRWEVKDVPHVMYVNS